MTLIRFAALFTVVSLLAGCNSTRRGGGSTEEGYALLQEVNDLLRAAAGATGRAPTKVADLNSRQGMFPRAYEAIKSGTVVVVWGAPSKGEGEASSSDPVVAYEQTVPTNGGFVLLAGGTVKKMSASEFQSAPKAK
jgi:hypothetical protein